MKGQFRKVWLLLVCVVLGGLFPELLAAQAEGQIDPIAQSVPSQPKAQELALAQVVMCERVENLKPINRAIVFPVSAGQVCCFTIFNPVPEPTIVYHRWFHRDELSTQIRLKLYSPQWSTYSLIQLRDTDKGPWRVEVTDRNGTVLNVLHFSITD